MEYSTMISAFTGEAGLLFCGVEMSVEKGFYLVTLMAFVNSLILQNFSDPYGSVNDGDDDDDAARRLLRVVGVGLGVGTPLH